MFGWFCSFFSDFLIFSNTTYLYNRSSFHADRTICEPKAYCCVAVELERSPTFKKYFLQNVSNYQQFSAKVLTSSWITRVPWRNSRHKLHYSLKTSERILTCIQIPIVQNNSLLQFLGPAWLDANREFSPRASKWQPCRVICQTQEKATKLTNVHTQYFIVQ